MKLKDDKIISINPVGVNYITYLLGDSNNLANWAGQLFNNNVDLNNPMYLDYKKAAELSIKELESDIAKLKELLSEYEPLKPTE
jgi:predicted translin family RNA/ssDNA-binding protein